ncbi:GAF domain-containing protein [Lutimonas vermicola]|uniref:GAF domain-containing protein n=1 Tax=Lutimonas vermicola TaxID=414288 RepID=A0ABU9KZH7_9FLAO
MIIENKITQIINSEVSNAEKLQQICNLLKKNIPHFHWVGFYFINGDKKELKLAQFAGKPTEHTIIPFGKGICGQVALSNENFVVQDVTEQDNYISCGMEVKSEIVVPIFQNNKNIGQIDIDSHDVAPFSNDDESLLEFICSEVASLNLDTVLNRDPS